MPFEHLPAARTASCAGSGSWCFLASQPHERLVPSSEELDGRVAGIGHLPEASGERMSIVALTGWGQEADRRRSREAGFDAHLVKPVAYDTIARLLANL